MIDDAGVPSEYLEWHGHNDFYKGVIGAVSAWLYGCTFVNGTLLGIGESTGNTPIEGLIMEYMSLVGEDNGSDTRAITEMEELFRKRDRVPRPEKPAVRRLRLQRHVGRCPHRRARQERGDLLVF